MLDPEPPVQERLGQRPVRIEAGIAQSAAPEQEGEEEGTAQRGEHGQRPVAAQLDQSRHAARRLFSRQSRIEAPDSERLMKCPPCEP
jgi:hypothetical protein